MTPFSKDIEILVVEDEPLIAYEIAMTLEEAGATVVGPVRTLAAALSTIATSTPTAAVLDVRLGRDEIGPAAAALALKKVPFVFHTGHGDATVLGLWPDRPIIYKPAPPRAIVEAIVQVLNSRLTTSDNAENHPTE
jgi:DNA-binding NarL/FixJ family response regulator